MFKINKLMFLSLFFITSCSEKTIDAAGNSIDATHFISIFIKNPIVLGVICIILFFIFLAIMAIGEG